MSINFSSASCCRCFRIYTDYLFNIYYYKYRRGAIMNERELRRSMFGACNNIMMRVFKRSKGITKRHDSSKVSLNFLWNDERCQVPRYETEVQRYLNGRIYGGRPHFLITCYKDTAPETVLNQNNHKRRSSHRLICHQSETSSQWNIFYRNKQPSSFWEMHEIIV